jgi:hypothetical protein
MLLRVVDDILTGEPNEWRYSFNDGSSVVVKEVYETSPPHLKMVSGDFTQERKEAIYAYGRLEVRA